MAVYTQDNAKLVTLANLALYNHKLIEKLGLKQDNGVYEYAASSLTEDAKATNVKGALDHLYDLVKEARTSAFKTTSISAQQPTDAYIRFFTGEKDENGVQYEIEDAQIHLISDDKNLTFGENSNDFSQLILDVKSIGYGVTKEALNEDEKNEYGYTGDIYGDPLTQKTYVDNEIKRAINNGTAKVETGKATGDVKGTAEFTQVKNGKGKATSNDYYVHLTAGDNVYDILLNADDFVKDAFLKQVEIVKGSNESGEFTEGEGDTYFKFVWNVDNGAEGEEAATKTTYIKTSDILGDLTAGNGIEINDGATISVKVDENADDNSVKLTSGNDGVKVEVTSNKIASGTTEDGKTTWSLESNNESVIADATTTVAAINDLQGRIDILNAASLVDGTAINDITATGHTLTKKTVDDGKENAGATYYELKLATTTDADITNLFAACDLTDEPGEPNS